LIKVLNTVLIVSLIAIVGSQVYHMATCSFDRFIFVISLTLELPALAFIVVRYISKKKDNDEEVAGELGGEEADAAVFQIED
jgi:hypothetical protein